MMRLLTLFFLTLPAVDALAFLSHLEPQPIASIVDLAKNQVGRSLNLLLQAGEDSNAPQLYMQGLQLQLNGNHNKNHVPMPGQCSSGSFDVDIVQHPSYVGIEGLTQVKLNNACWELVWRKDSPSGSLVCGFDIDREYNRGQAVLHKGPLYVSFSVWTHDTLVDLQARKMDAITRGKELINERNQEIIKMRSTNNPIMKALHYRKAAEAVERLSLTGYHHYNSDEIPDNDHVVPIGDNLLLQTTGSVWTKDYISNSNGSFSFSYAKKPKIMGKVTLKESNTAAGNGINPLLKP